MIEYIYATANAQATSTALLSEIDATAMLGQVTSALSSNFTSISVIGATVVAVFLAFYLLRKVVALFPR